jgi:hypothetical protein
MSKFELLEKGMCFAVQRVSLWTQRLQNRNAKLQTGEEVEQG